MEVHEGTVKSLVRALARGDLEVLERCVLAIANGEKVHPEYRDEEMFQWERQLIAWRCGLPPFHRNPARSEIIRQRTRERRLVGCYAEVVPKGVSGEPPAPIRGMIVDEDDDSWTVSVKQPSVSATKPISIPLRIKLDDIVVCEVRVNPLQLAVRPEFANESQQYMGLPPWFTPNQGIAM